MSDSVLLNERVIFLGGFNRCTVLSLVLHIQVKLLVCFCLHSEYFVNSVISN